MDEATRARHVEAVRRDGYAIVEDAIAVLPNGSMAAASAARSGMAARAC
jgi:hypothetical protein